MFWGDSQSTPGLVWWAFLISCDPRFRIGKDHFLWLQNLLGPYLPCDSLAPNKKDQYVLDIQDTLLNIKYIKYAVQTILHHQAEQMVQCQSCSNFKVVHWWQPSQCTRKGGSLLWCQQHYFCNIVPYNSTVLAKNVEDWREKASRLYGMCCYWSTVTK